MHSFLLSLFTLGTGQKPPAETAQVSLQYDGWTPGWATLLGLALFAGVVVLYWRAPRTLSWPRRLTLIGLRCLFLASFLALLTRPVLFLTLEEPVRRTLLVLVDSSRSMNLKDQRVSPDDVKRAALAVGVLDPAKGLGQEAPPSPSGPAPYRSLSRIDLLAAEAANAKLNLWPRLHKQANLAFYGFGRGVDDLGPLDAKGTAGGDDDGGTPLTPAASEAFFRKIGTGANADATAIGDALRTVLDRKRGQPLAGILLITDGQNNSGVPPAEAAALAARDGVPLYVYGVGIASPLDIVVTRLEGPSTTYTKEKALFTVRVKGLGLVGRSATVVFKADGKEVDRKTVDFHDELEQEVTLAFEPQKKGEVLLEASVPPVDGESVLTNNGISTHIRVTDDKLPVLVVEQEPRWDFIFLFDLLRRDRRLTAKAVMLGGEADLSKGADSPYLDKIPDTVAALSAYQVVILGDVDPAKLGDARMQALAEWVEKDGGGLLFLAGPKFNPAAYRNTPLEPLFPVELTAEGVSERYPVPVQLERTPAGEISPLLAIDDPASGEKSAWLDFPGVSWTARVGRARPAAQTLLVDPTSSRASRDGPMPVIAVQNYGTGQCVYVGTNETYLWRSKTGEKYHTRIWGQIIQSLSASQGGSGSGAVRLKVDQPRYLVGERIVVSATSPGAAASDTAMPGSLSVQPPPADGSNAPAPPPEIADLRLNPIPGRPGEYRGETIARVAGRATFAVQDGTSVAFDIDPLRLEETETALNVKLLQAVAEAGHGKFLREEDLNGLPDLVASGSVPEPVFKKLEIVFQSWILLFMIAVAACEWIVRRLSQLK